MSSYSIIEEEVETNLSHEVRLIYASVAHSVVHSNNFCFLPHMIKSYKHIYSLYTESIFSRSKWCGSLQQQIC